MGSSVQRGKREAVVGDVYDDAIGGIMKLRHEWDVERVQHPELYGSAPRSVWKRLRAWARRSARTAGKG